MRHDRAHDVAARGPSAAAAAATPAAAMTAATRRYPAATIEQLESIVAAADEYEQARRDGWSARLADRPGYRLGDPAMYAATSREHALQDALGECPGTFANRQRRATGGE